MGSSQVGTPGVNPAPQEIGQAVGEGATETAGAGFNIAVEKQNLRNEGEFASLMLDHSQRIMDAAEQIKKQDAANPDAMTGDLTKAMSQSLAIESSKASNPFVKLMVQRGDPSAQMWALRQINQDAAQQGWQNTLKHATETGNGFINKAMAIGQNPDLTPQEMITQAAPLFHGVGLLHTTIANSLHAEQADGIANGVAKGIMKGIIDPTLETQPWKTSGLLANPEVAKYFTPDELRTYQKSTDDALKAFPAKMQNLQIQNTLATYPSAVKDVLSGKMGFGKLDAAQRQDPDKGNTAMWNYLKDISLNVATAPGEGNLADKDALKGQFVDEAARLGLKLPGQFSSTADQNDFLAPKIDQNVKDLYKFRDDMISALSRKIISPEEFSIYNKQLLAPLTAATLKNNDPNFFQKVWNSPQNPFHDSDPSKVDDFRSPYNIIERALSLHQMDEKSPEYFTAKSNAYDTYFKALDAVKPGQLNALGRPYSPVDVAHAVMGEELGKDIIVKGQAVGKIAGYDPKDGMPIIDTPPEWQQTLANAKNLKDIR